MLDALLDLQAGDDGRGDLDRRRAGLLDVQALDVVAGVALARHAELMVGQHALVADLGRRAVEAHMAGQHVDAGIDPRLAEIAADAIDEAAGFYIVDASQDDVEGLEQAEAELARDVAVEGGDAMA